MFEEVFMSPLTTGTTCYSGARSIATDKEGFLRFATENNLLGIKFSSQVETFSHELPGWIGKGMICIGYSQCGDIQTMAFLDSSSMVVDDFEEDAIILSRPFEKDESDSSVVTATTKTETQQTKPETFNPVKAGLLLKTLDCEYFAPLTGSRPLCPCVAKWGNKSIGVYFGSADDNLLRLYVPKEGESEDGQKMLEAKQLDEKHFNFKTPVMAIDFTESPFSGIVLLAIACQDGTIQMISWKGDNFEELTSYQVIVDGPILSLQILKPDDSPLLRVVAGSLCGYVCELVSSNDGQLWEGPSMIVQGFWNQAIQAEDSVLAIHIWKDYILVGTHGGRCMMYKKKGNHEYVKVWECLLPYSIHSMVVVPKKDDSKNAVFILVTTRRSLHVFTKKECPSSMSSSDLEKEKDKIFNIDLVKERLLKLLKSNVSEYAERIGNDDETNILDEEETSKDHHFQAAIAKESCQPQNSSLEEIRGQNCQ
jgi:hypothetical protein